MGNELKIKILEHNGITSDETEKKKPSILECPRCNLINLLENKYCSKCSYPLKPEAFDELKLNEEDRFRALEKKYTEKITDLANEMEIKFEKILSKIDINLLTLDELGSIDNKKTLV
jgi:hypothetical protein